VRRTLPASGSYNSGGSRCSIGVESPRNSLAGATAAGYAPAGTKAKPIDSAHAAFWVVNMLTGNSCGAHQTWVGAKPIGLRIRAVGYEGDGTSMSAPMVAGVASILMEVNSELVGWPEIVRSILMATASNDVDRGFLDSDDCWRYDNGSWYCGAEVGPEGLRERDDRDGAGEVSAFVAAFLSLGDFHVQHNNSPVKWGWDYGWMGYYQDFNGDNSWWVKNYYIDANSWGWPIRVVLSWDATATCSDVEDPGTCFSPTYLLDFDLDLYVYDTTTGGIVASSLSQYNSYEFVQFSPTPGRTYRIAVKLYDHNYSSTYFGLAWSSWPFVNN